MKKKKRNTRELIYDAHELQASHFNCPREKNRMIQISHNPT